MTLELCEPMWTPTERYRGGLITSRVPELRLAPPKVPWDAMVVPFGDTPLEAPKKYGFYGVDWDNTDDFSLMFLGHFRFLSEKMLSYFPGVKPESEVFNFSPSPTGFPCENQVVILWLHFKYAKDNLQTSFWRGSPDWKKKWLKAMELVLFLPSTAYGLFSEPSAYQALCRRSQPTL